MAVAFVADRVSTQNSTVGSAQLLTFTTGASIGVNNTLLLYVSYDEGAAVGGASITSVKGVALGIANSYWQRVARIANDQSGTDAGVVTEIWACRVRYAIANGAQIYVSFSESITRGVFLVKEFSGVSPNFAVGPGGTLVGPLYGNSVAGNTGTGTGTTIGSLAITPAAAGSLLIGVAGIETNTAITGDSDTTDGTWSTIGTTKSDSGTDATSVTLSEQYKIVTGVSAQNWAVTKTGAADWAAAVVVFPAYVPTAPTTPPGNPNYPCIAGYEGLPTDQLVVPLDTGTGYVYTVPSVYPNAANTDSLAANAALENAKDGLSQHVLTWDLAYTASTLADDVPVRVTVPLTAANTTGSWSAPATSALDAVTKIGQGYLRLDIGETLDFTVDGIAFQTAYPNSRILNIGLRYIAWRDDDTYDGGSSAPSVGFKTTWKDARNTAYGSPTAYNYGYWLVPNYRSTMAYEYRSMGETNHIPAQPGGYDANSVRSWGLRDIYDQVIGTGTSFTLTAVQGSNTDQSVIFFDYIEVVIDIVPERRFGTASTLVTNIPFVYDNVVALRTTPPFDFDDNIFASFYNADALSRNQVYPYFILPDVNTQTGPLMLTLREARPADGSDFFRALVVDPDTPGNVEAQYSSAEATGSPLRLQALTNIRDTQTPQPTMYLGTYVDGLPQDADNFPQIKEYIPAVSIYPRKLSVSDGFLWPEFNVLGVPNEVIVTDSITQTQYVQVDGATAFKYVKILVKPDPTTTGTDTLNISIQQPLATPIATATITATAVNALEDVGNGWKEATIAITGGGTITPTAGQVALVFSVSSSITGAHRFYVQGSYARTVDSGYNNSAPNDDTRPTDSSAVLMCAIPAPSVTLGSTSLTMLPLYPNFTGCLTGSYQHPLLSVSNKNSFDYITIERSSDGGVTWQYAWGAARGAWSGGFGDQEVPWDIQILYPITYRVRGYRNADRNFAETITSAWTGTSTSPGQVFGLASNDSGYEFWFTPVTEGALEVQWTPLSPIDFVELHGKDYSYAMRPAEDRGFELTVPIVVNQTSFCATTGSSYIANVTPYGEALGKGARAMSPRMYEAFVLPIIRSSARWTLKLPGGHTRTVSVSAGDFSTITVSGLYLTELKIRDVVEPDPDPYCPGL